MSFSFVKGKLTLSIILSVLLTTLFVAFVAQGVTYVDTDSVGVATATPGGALGVKGAAFIEDFLSVSTLYATSSLGVGTNTPAAALGVDGAAIFGGFVSADYYTATSTGTSWLLGNLGIGTTTPGAQFAVDEAGLFAGHLTASTFAATSTTATSTYNGGLSIAESAGTFGIGTSTPGNAANVGIEGQEVYQSSGATTTLTITSSSATQGGCIQLLHPNSGIYWRLYIGSEGNTVGGGAAQLDGLVIEEGECQ